MSRWKTVAGLWKAIGLGDPSTADQGPLPVQIRSSAGAAQDLGKAEDSAHVSGDVGVQVLGVRKDTVGSLVSADGDYSPLQVDENGSLRVALNGGAIGGNQPINAVNSPDTSDARSPNTWIGLSVNANGILFNGTTWDRERANEELTVLASAARTATTASGTQTNYNGRGVNVFVDVTAITTAPSITVAIQGLDPVSGKWITLLTSAAITTVSTTHLRIYPGVAAAANTKADEALPRRWRVNVTHANADSITYSVGACVAL